MANILIVDDSKAVHAFITATLKKTNLVITHAYNGKEAVDILAAKTAGPFDLIMLDWEMPILTGPEAFAQMKELKVSTPVLMMTTKNHPDDILKMVSEGVREYMLKPFTSDILFEKMEFCMGKEVERVA